MTETISVVLLAVLCLLAAIEFVLNLKKDKLECKSHDEHCKLVAHLQTRLSASQAENEKLYCLLKSIPRENKIGESSEKH